MEAASTAEIIAAVDLTAFTHMLPLPYIFYITQFHIAIWARWAHLSSFHACRVFAVWMNGLRSPDFRVKRLNIAARARWG